MSQSATSATQRLIASAVNMLIARPAEQSALPILYATAAPGAVPGVFIGPTGPRQNTRVTLDDLVGPATDGQLAARLWDASEDLTGVKYPKKS